MFLIYHTARSFNIFCVQFIYLITYLHYWGQWAVHSISFNCRSNDILWNSVTSQMIDYVDQRIYYVVQLKVKGYVL